MNKTFLPAAIATTLLLTACGGESNNPSNTDPNSQSPGTEQVHGKSLVMNIDLAQLQSTGLTADKIVVTISKGEFTEILEITHENYAATAEFSDLVVGDYQIQVDVFDGETLVAEGTASATVSANQVATTDLRLELKAGGLVVNVCVPGQAPDTLWTDQFEYKVQNDLSSIGAEAAGPAGGVPDYHNSLPYADLKKDDQLSVGISVDQVFEQVPEGHYLAISDHHSLTIKNNGEDVITLSGCNAEVSLKEAQPYGMFNSEGMYGSNLSGNTIELRVRIPVNGYDYLAQGDLIFSKEIGGTEPFYRQITELSYVVLFDEKAALSSISEEELAQAKDLSALFSNPEYIHEAYIQTSGTSEQLYPMQLAFIETGDFTPHPFVLLPVVEEVVE